MEILYNSRVIIREEILHIMPNKCLKTWCCHSPEYRQPDHIGCWCCHPYRTPPVSSWCHLTSTIRPSDHKGCLW